MGYIITGDSLAYGYKDCLVKVLCVATKADAEKLFKEFLDSDDLYKIHHTNFKLEETRKEEEWWNDPVLAN